MSNVEWKPVVGFESAYEVSSTGEIRTIARKVKCRGGKYRIIASKVLSPHIGQDGYLHVMLSNQGKSKLVSVHRVVATAFIPNPENKPQVNHRDGNKTNPCVNNLEWVTRSENAQHAIRNNLWIPKHSGDASARRCGIPVKCLETGEVYRSKIAAALANNMDDASVEDSIRTGRPRKGCTFVLADRKEVDIDA